MSGNYEPVIAEFLRLGKFIEPACKSAKIRALFVDRGSGTFSPVVARAHLLPEPLVTDVFTIWESRHLRICERTVRLQSIEDLFDSLVSNRLAIDSFPIGFQETEEPKWELEVKVHTGYIAPQQESGTLMLKGSIMVDRPPRGNEPYVQNELQTNPRGTYTSICSLTKDFLGKEYPDLTRKEIEIIVPTLTKLTNLDYYGQKVDLRIKCRKELAPELKLWAIFFLPDGEIRQFHPRFYKPKTRERDEGWMEISKSFNTPVDAQNACSVKVTVSAGGPQGLALHSRSSIRWPVDNVVRATIGALDQSKVEKYFDLGEFESKYRGLGSGKDSSILEAVVSASFACCGFHTTWMGGFGLPCEDIFAFMPSTTTVLVVECTVGAPMKKIGLMKTAISSLQSEIDWLDFKGVVITSNDSSDPEKESARRNGIVLLDVTDLKHLVELASNAPNPEVVLDWLGIV